MSGIPEGLLGAEITIGPCPEVPQPLFAAASSEAELRVTRERARLDVFGVAAIAAEAGARVWINPVSDGLIEDLKPWLFGSIASLILAQQGRFALHASVVQLGEVGIAIAGSRGAGKSTTALRLIQSGHQLIADDVAPLRFDNRPIVTPYGRPIHVTREAADAIGLDLGQAVPLSDEDSKLELPSPPSREAALDVIVVLRPEPGAELVARAETGAAAVALIAENVYRGEVLASVYPREIFQWGAAVARHTRVFVLYRPEEGWMVEPINSAVVGLAKRHCRHGVSA